MEYWEREYLRIINEDKEIRWEQKQIKKIKRFIYNIIVKLEG